MRTRQPIEGPTEYSARFWSELLELVDQGEISPAIARRIAQDVFEPVEPGAPPRVKLKFWWLYRQEQEALAAIRDKGRRSGGA